MTLNISFSRQPSQETECAILCVYKDKGKSPSAQDFDQKLDGFVDHALSCVKSFSGKKGEVELVLLPKSAKYSYALLLGLGEEEELTPVDAEKLGGILYSALKKHHIETCTFFADNELRESTLLTIHMAVGMTLRSYDFDIYQSKKDEEKTSKSLQSAEFVLFEHEKAEIIFQRQYAAVQGTFLARDFVNEPPNILYPEAYAQRIQDELKPLGVKVDVLDEKKMAKLGMGALLAVGQGSDHAPRMVIMRWNGDQDSKSDPIAFVGKGVTFDTGGISLKPGAGMEEMKMDMGGSAAVVGLMKALALRKSKSNVVGIVGLVENMPSARSYRPADILTSYSGKTIEVLNTDAEGRLVLADALSYVQDIYKPQIIIDLATLTGAMLVALGHEYCGTFTTDDTLWKQMDEAGKATDEKLWRMPLDDVWKKDMEGTITDTQNMAKSGRWAGSCTAAGFLWHFIEGDVPWAHMDIAGTAWIKKDKDITPKYGTGFGVRLLDYFVAQNYEND